MEIQMVSLDGSSKGIEKEITKKHGPTPTKLPFERYGLLIPKLLLRNCKL